MKKIKQKNVININDEQKIENLIKKLTLKEKVSLLSGRNSWETVSLEEHGIYSITVTDGPHGVRSNQADTGRIVKPVTCFPTGVSMAASWNPELVERLGIALAEETRAMGCDVILGPCINIVRHPLAGRNFESFSEDPYLAGRIGVGYVKGVQSRGIGTSVKHFACNNQEKERHRGSSVVDERTLREIYLPAFETIVKEAKPWTVMCSYNRINGDYASQNYHLLTEILKDEWGFKGIVVSDWGAVHTTVESKKAGLDLEMPGPARYYGDLLSQAVHIYQLDEKAVNDSVRRILRVLARAGRLGKPITSFKGSVNTPEHQKLARELAGESIVLLKNENSLLPLDLNKIKSIAVIGPNADDMQAEGGGSSYVEPLYKVSPLQALKKISGKRVKIRYEQGCDNFVNPPLLKSEYLTPAEGKGHGLTGEYFNNLSFSGKPVLKRIDKHIDLWCWYNTPDKRITKKHFSIRWSGLFTSPETGCYVFQVTNIGTCRIYLNNKLLIKNVSPNQSEAFNFSAITGSAECELIKGKKYEIKIEFMKNTREYFTNIKLVLARSYRGSEDKRITHAVEIARQCDIALIFVGVPAGYETEGWDRPDIKLTSRQNELIEAVAGANKNTAVIINCGTPVAMPWIDDVPGVIDILYPGMEGGNAIANILIGKKNPSGRLPVTFPKRLQDTSAYINYPGTKEVQYGEEIFVGYRYYDKKEVDPLFPFGHGLSYTAFEYSNLQAPKNVKQGSPVNISIQIKNIGKREGKEVIQLYIHDKKSSLVRPKKELKGFKKVSLKPGESKIVRFVVNQRDLSYYDPYKAEWIAEPGEFEVMIGSSSRNIQAKKTFNFV